VAINGAGTALEFPPLTFLAEGDEVTVGRPDLDVYAIFPSDGAAVLHRLVAGSTPAEAADWYADTYGQGLDIDDFVRMLREFNLVGTAAPATSLRWQRLGRAAFSPAAWLAYAALAAAGVAVIVRTPGLVPRYEHIFFSPSLVVVELVLFFGQVPGVLLHEGFHALAGRRAGLRSRLTIGRRLYYLVAVTEMDGLVALPRAQRYLPILAGLVADVLCFCLLTLTAAVAGGVLGAVCLGLAFVTVLRAGWQFQFYLRTDLYVLVSTVLRMPDLHGAAWSVVRGQVNRLLGRRNRPVLEARWGARELRHARWYAVLLMVGYGVATAMLVAAVLPAAARLVSVTFGRLLDPGHAGVGGVADAGVFLLLNLAQFAVVAVLAWRDRRGGAAGGTP
jgi:hypothetical protein